jgi:hypothetical protein
MLRFILVLVITMSVGLYAYAYNISAETNPKLGTTNIFDNGDAEKGTDKPDNWIDNAKPPNHVYEWSNFAYSGKKSLYAKVTDGGFVGYWKNSTSTKYVPADQELLFSYWINMPWGVAEPYVYGYFDRNIPGTSEFESYTASTALTAMPNPLYPIFVKNENLFRHKPINSGWNRISVKVGKRPKAMAQDIGCLLLLKYLPSNEGKISECWIDKVYYGAETVNLTVKIDGEISKIKEVQIYNDANELSYSTTDIPKSGEFTIPVLADSYSYKISLKDSDGKEYSKVIE